MKKLLLIALVVSTSAHADVRIAMKPGSHCWTYQGMDTRFVGKFSAGQAITVAVVSEQPKARGSEVVTYDAKEIWVNGPGLYRSGNEENNSRVIQAEKSGEYTFNLNEHGTGGAGPVFVKICASNKSLIHPPR